VWAISRPKDQSADAVFTRDGREVAAFRFHDALRGESSDEVHALGKRGLRVSILSGDREPKVAAIAAQLASARDQWHHSLTPDEKAAWIATHDPQATLYIGDGANDSLAFDAASCAGSPVTGRSFLEHKADFYFLGHSMRFHEQPARHRRHASPSPCMPSSPSPSPTTSSPPSWASWAISARCWPPF
jgi:Cu2+-exporting ATPase